MLQLCTKLRITSAAKAGALCINDGRFRERAEILRDKGTNRQKFFRGEIDKYTWVDLGSSYVPSEICSAFLYGQLEMMDEISTRRRDLYHYYIHSLAPLAAEGLVQLPETPEECQTNYHMFYLVLPTGDARDALLVYLKLQGIHAVFHYVPLHSSPMGLKFGGRSSLLPVTENLASRLLRLPLFYDLTEADQTRIVECVVAFLKKEPGQSRRIESEMFLAAH